MQHKSSITQDKIMSQIELDKLLTACRARAELDLIHGRKTWINRHTLVYLAIVSGLRVSEIAALTIGNLRLSDKMPFVVVWHPDKALKRDVFVDHDAADHIRSYIAHKMNVFGESVHLASPLFSSKSGIRYTTTALEISWLQATKEAGIRQVPISYARHSHAAKLLAETRDIRFVCDQLGFTAVHAARYVDIGSLCSNETGYSLPHCYQYAKRIENLEEDVRNCGLPLNELKSLRVNDFVFSAYAKDQSSDSKEYSFVLQEVRKLIQRSEWLGKMSLYPSHIFTAEYKDILAGVIVMDMPTNFSKLLGEQTSTLERLVSRGACVSWSPKGLASWLLMKAVNWTVINTKYRLFSAYSDPEARELGTIYQSCNWIYIGQKAGTCKMYKKDGTWRSDRYFRSRSAYKRYAKELGIEWHDEWQVRDRIIWTKIPNDIEKNLRKASKDAMAELPSRDAAKKHKYIYILGRTKAETKLLRKRFETLNPHLVNVPYPKERGK